MPMIGKEFTLRAIVLGVLLAVVFGAANAYLGLRIGMTVSASIPAAVVSMAILRGLLRRGTILENNIVQTIASAGESLAAGVIFTIPAVILLGLDASVYFTFVVSLIGGILGVLLMVPLRKHLIEDEHGVLPYPEGTACAEVLKAGEEGGEKAKFVFLGFTAGGIFKFLGSALRLFGMAPGMLIRGYNAYIGIDLSPSLLGVGYILGLRISSLVLAGGLLGWAVLIPLIARFSGVSVVSADDLFSIWSHDVRFIGAGAVLMGGLVSLGKSAKYILKALGQVSLSFGKSRDLPMAYVLGGLAVVIVAMPLLLGLSFWLSILLVVFAFLFVAVSSRIVGIVGSSSNPVSGMTIAALFAISLLFAAMGMKDTKAMFLAMTFGAVVCIAAAIAGDTSQDLKTGYLVGATPWKQQVAELLGVLFVALVIGYVLKLLDAAYHIGSRDLSAPQATIMSMVVKGVMSGTVPWVLILSGMAIALVVELLGVDSLPVAVGLYLPVELSTPLFVGGLLSHFLRHDDGTLYASGLVAGDALMGIVIAILVVLGVNLELRADIGVFSSMIGALSYISLMVIFALIARRRRNGR